MQVCRPPNTPDRFAPRTITPRACATGDNGFGGWSAHTVWHLKCRTTSRMSNSFGMVRDLPACSAARRHPASTDPPRRARRHCVHAMSGRGEHRQLSARVPQRHHELQMYAVHDFYRPPLTKDSRVPRQQVQRVEMHIPRAGGRTICNTQGVCAPTDDILSIAGTCIW